ncbi:phenol-soluble modulin export ABC transporter ATP-binding protein PmtC [Staphylococcus warneri]|jgi:ABC-2 type transport system ATP-binding protein|uniref:Phenol-soluble modulin export ABC transporter ATP-binding protein PmtC n=2 Tax=Staphylococcus TaxID=1279 RepID=A0A5F0TY85_STAWA|nr:MULTISPECIES: phenol-soluble modulin export ABC transporter ATP-binding protein PmtC [Staphylococcus]MBJ7883513.1 phenol-soluble modulin export ABC transporter ATP-binding protein PmtC [Bacillaceae bacterium HSR45]PAK72221.1 antibiotic ABC transporter ATP-binding protein [Staphylococcus pasteuri]AGC90188.1 ABC transporter ATP-binding protein [Staphylococcus warneri SG1]AXZ23013.1 phenol-soluble modulin export ABC transporter ATP-binding protein PmtC [Staphylococcus warneri]EGG97230.1 ABC tr
MKLEQITKKYGQNTVIDHIDFDFGNSQIVGLIGKNGVGKTTLMKVMNGNIINYEGKVNLPNNENVGYLIEHPKLYDNKTGLYNLKLFAQVLGKGFDKEYADHIIDAFGMRPYIKKKVKKYSMGMKQKLAIAVSLMNKPKYLILDEPTNGMDPDGSIDVLKTIQSLVKQLEMKILISSHKLEDIELICDRAVFLRDGTFVQDVNMKDGGPKDSTIISIDTEDYQKALEMLTEKFHVQQSNKENGEIIIKAQKNYKDVLEALAKLNIYPKYIETRKSSLRDTYFNINQRGDK